MGDFCGMTVAKISPDRITFKGDVKQVTNVEGWISTSGNFTSYAEDETVGKPHHIEGLDIRYGNNYRQNVGTWALQINTSATMGFVEVDIDQFNPSFGLGPMLAHFFGEVLPHTLNTRSYTNPWDVGKALAQRGVTLGLQCGGGFW